MLHSLYNEFKHSGLLFVGCNPSFPEKSLAAWIKDALPEVRDLDLRRLFSWKNVRNSRKVIGDIRKIELRVRGNKDQMPYAYFSPLIDIAKNTDFEDNWEHVDVFLTRHTSQGEFKKHIEVKGQLTEFGQKQLEIFKSVLLAVNPKIIVVSNAYISELMQRKECFGDKLERDNVHGWHNLTLKENNPIPIFFSSMISGQRALDIESRKRLIWHIKKAREYLDAKYN